MNCNRKQIACEEVSFLSISVHVLILSDKAALPNCGHVFVANYLRKPIEKLEWPVIL